MNPTGSTMRNGWLSLTDRVAPIWWNTQVFLNSTQILIGVVQLSYLRWYHKAKLSATVFTYTFGIIAALIVGVGMCLSMKIIGCGTTAMFVLGLQTAMLSRFSENGESYRKMMNAITGRFVYGIVILNAVLMLLHNIKIRKKVKSIE